MVTMMVTMMNVSLDGFRWLWREFLVTSPSQAQPKPAVLDTCTVLAYLCIWHYTQYIHWSLILMNVSLDVYRESCWWCLLPRTYQNQLVGHMHCLYIWHHMQYIHHIYTVNIGCVLLKQKENRRDGCHKTKNSTKNCHKVQVCPFKKLACALCNKYYTIQLQCADFYPYYISDKWQLQARLLWRQQQNRWLPRGSHICHQMEVWKYQLL